MIDQAIIPSIIGLGPTAFVSISFLYYLYLRNGREEKAMAKLNESIERNTRVLIKVALKHKLIDEAEELIET